MGSQELNAAVRTFPIHIHISPPPLPPHVDQVLVCRSYTLSVCPHTLANTSSRTLMDLAGSHRENLEENCTCIEKYLYTIEKFREREMYI
jgi:hypothetical protein